MKSITTYYARYVHLSVLFLLLINSASFAQVGVGTKKPDKSAILDLNSNNQGLLVPRMTATQRLSIKNPAKGLLVYDNDSTTFAYFDGNAWQFITAQGKGLGALKKQNPWTRQNNKTYLVNLGDSVGIGMNNPIFKLDVTDDINIAAGKAYRIGGIPVLHTRGIRNISAGNYAGISIINGNRNVFVGDSAGTQNTEAFQNTFVGANAGRFNTLGPYNSFFGSNAGYFNATGNRNSFFGIAAGYSNSLGSQNSFFGAEAGYSNIIGNNNSFVGNNAGRANTTGSNNSFVGVSAGEANTTGFQNSFFGSFSGLSNTSGINNSFFGTTTGRQNTIGSYNTFVGAYAGRDNTTGGNNTFVGSLSGQLNTTGFHNSFFGTSAGGSNTTGTQNTFAGQSSGQVNTSGRHNTFYGTNSGFFTTTGNDNFYGGYEAGRDNTSGYSNTAVGARSGFDFNGNRNTFIGDSADATVNNLTNSTAIGYNAKVSQSNSIVLGNAFITKWGFGTNVIEGRALQVGTNPTNGNGAFLSAGGVWTNTSDKNKKENFISLDSKEILAKIMMLKITRWNYIGEAKDNTHIGPMAQDFYSLFNTGNDPKTISTIDPAGVALIAIQELHKENLELKAELESMRTKFAEIQASIKSLESTKPTASTK